MIVEQIQVGMMDVFCYVISDGISGEGILIDPAAEFGKIEEYIRKNKLRITAVVNTHGHFDHTGGNRYFASKTGSKVFIHGDDLPGLHSGLSRFMDFIRGRWARSYETVSLNDGDIIRAGDMGVRVIHTPGHSRGSICLYSDGNLFTGDTLFTEGTGRTDFAGGSEAELIKSVREKILSLPDDTKIWPGHNYGRFPVSTVREQKLIYC